MAADTVRPDFTSPWWRLKSCLTFLAAHISNLTSLPGIDPTGQGLCFIPDALHYPSSVISITMKNRFYGKIKKAWEDYEIGQVFINGRAYHGKHPIKESLKSLLYWMIAVVIIILIINLS